MKKTIDVNDIQEVREDVKAFKRGIPKDRFIDILNRYHGDKPIMFEDMLYLFFLFGNTYDDDGNLLKENFAESVDKVVKEK